jgi:hypothetical protein
MRHAIAVVCLASALAALPFVSAQPGFTAGEKPIDLPFGEKGWDMSAMNAEPVKLVRTSATQISVRAEDPETKAKFSTEVKYVRFLLEFTRDLTVRDIDWTGVQPQPPFRFEFQDADGVTQRIVPATYEGALVGRKGRRVWVVVKIPEESLERRTKKVVIDLKPYGS